VATRTVYRFAAAIGLTVLGAAPAAAADADLGTLAGCIRESGAVFYGAHWCPVCRKQNEYFDGYAYLLPYVECYDGPKDDGMNATCKQERIERFPTWVFPDGSRKTGAREPRSLAAAAGCRAD